MAMLWQLFSSRLFETQETEETYELLFRPLRGDYGIYL